MHQVVRHQTALEGVETILLRSDHTFPRHSHDEFGFGYIAHGGQYSWSGRGMIEAEAGDTITVNPSELHDGIGREGQPRHWRMLFLTPDAFAKLYDASPGGSEFPLPVVRSRRTAKLVAAAVDAAASDIAEKEDLEALIILALDALLDQAAQRSEAAPVKISPEITNVLELIFDQYSDPLSLADFSTAAGMNRFQVIRRFSIEVGSTPHAYLMQHRVKRAKAMILDGTTLAEAAIASGFFDQSHLTRTFFRQLGLTPGTYLRTGQA